MDHDHKELINKLETLEERVEKLESENQELKKGSEKHLQTSDNKLDTEKKISDDLVKVDGDTKIVKDEPVKSKSDSALTAVNHAKDNNPTTDTAVHQAAPVVSLEHKEEQKVIKDDTKPDLNLDPVKKELTKENNVPDVQQHKEQSKLDDHIPNLSHDKAEHTSDKEHQSDKVLLEKPDVQLNADPPKLKVPTVEVKLPDGQLPADKTKRSVHENVQNLEQGLPKLNTGGDNIGVLSRDLLHNKHEGDDAKRATNTSQVQGDKTSQATTPPATQNDTTGSKTTNVGKRNMLSVKLTNDSEVQSLNSG